MSCVSFEVKCLGANMRLVVVAPQCAVACRPCRGHYSARRQLVPVQLRSERFGTGYMVGTAVAALEPAGHKVKYEALSWALPPVNSKFSWYPI